MTPLPEGHPELAWARELLFRRALRFARWGLDPHTWRTDGNLAAAFALVSERDVRAIEAFAFSHMGGM